MPSANCRLPYFTNLSYSNNSMACKWIKLLQLTDQCPLIMFFLPKNLKLVKCVAVHAHLVSYCMWQIGKKMLKLILLWNYPINSRYLLQSYSQICCLYKTSYVIFAHLMTCHVVDPLQKTNTFVHPFHLHRIIKL